MKTFQKVLAASTVCMLLFVLASCSRKGYGCKGRESWKHLERRINSPY